MIRSIRGGIPLLLFAATLAAPGYAVAQQPLPDENACRQGRGPCAVLYELTENMRALKRVDIARHRDDDDDDRERRRRVAVSQLLGFAVRGTPLCPEALVAVVASAATRHCTLNATGKDTISLVTGLGDFGGDVQVVIQESRDGVPTPDSPEVVIARGRFQGKMDFRPAILFSIPLGSVEGHLSLHGFSKKQPFAGVFRLPFLLPPVAGDAPLYLLNAPNDPELGDLSKWKLVPVAANEMAIGYPTVMFEIVFP